MSALSDRWRRLGPLLSQIVCAILGGYALCAMR
ncbi:iron uptake protein, partial [Burkholderia glumae]